MGEKNQCSYSVLTVYLCSYSVQTVNIEMSIVVSPYHLCDVMIVLNNARVNCSDLASLDSSGINRFVLVLLQHLKFRIIVFAI